LARRNPKRARTNSIMKVLVEGIARLQVMEASFAIWTNVGQKLHTETCALYLGWDISHLIVENDSKILIDMIAINCNLGGIVSILVRHVCNLLTLDWQVEFHHT